MKLNILLLLLLIIPSVNGISLINNNTVIEFNLSNLDGYYDSFLNISSEKNITITQENIPIANIKINSKDVILLISATIFISIIRFIKGGKYGV